MRRIVVLWIACLFGGILYLPPVWAADTTLVVGGRLAGDTTLTATDSNIAPLPGLNEPDDQMAETEPLFITPKKTALFSAILPGLGQAYNHQYWKIPVIYAGLGVAAYFIQDNLKNYNTFREIAAGRAGGDPAAFQRYPEYSNEVIIRARDYYRKNLDLTVLITALGYTLQILDAVVFAHLKTFDMSPDISFRAVPVVMPHNGLGLGIVVNF